MNILTLNAGSSSLKFKVFRLNLKTRDIELILSGGVYELSSLNSTFLVKDANSKVLIKESHNLQANAYTSALELILYSSELKQYKLEACIHRIVHGGDIFKDITLLSSEVMEQLSIFNEFAPLHQPYNLLIVEEVKRLFPSLPNYGCFDTAFHQTIPEINRIYAIPWQYTQDRVKKYGFHGLSYSYINSCLKNIVGEQLAKEKWIIAHLGSGSSLCAINQGQSVATTMGFSPLDGLPMLTRCGEVDPYFSLYLQNKYNLTSSEILEVLNKKSGLYGICGFKDMQDILASNSHLSKLALDYYCMQVASHIAKLSINLGGLLGIVFTGGVGENSSIIRQKICLNLQFLGVELDEQQNILHNAIINSINSKVEILVINTNEELAMVRQYIPLLS